MMHNNDNRTLLYNATMVIIEIISKSNRGYDVDVGIGV